MERVKSRRRDVRNLAKRDRWVSDGRLLVFLSGAVIAGFVIGQSLSWWWMTLPVVGFFSLLVFHETIRKQLQHAERSVLFYEQGLARLEGEWMGRGVSGSEFQDSAHLYAKDLDLFGTGSLFELLCTARTPGGVQTLAQWIKHSFDPKEIQVRQNAVQELSPQLDLRESLHLLGPNYRADLHVENLLTWSECIPNYNVGLHRGIVLSLSLGVVLVFIGFLLEWYGLGLVLGMAIVNGIYARVLRDKVYMPLLHIRRHQQDLALLLEFLGYIEATSLSSERVTFLRQKLVNQSTKPSQQLKKLVDLLTLDNSTRNQFFAAVSWAVLWTTNIALAVEAWRQCTGKELREWLMAVGEFEALVALSGYSYEHPKDNFPEVFEGKTIFDGKGLGHPLLPYTTCVRNDIKLGDTERMLLISGSNMSGKSTMLRTVGLNVVLAMAGAPVRANTLRISRIEIGATLVIQDSLQDGKSRFYAEITRLNQIMKLARAQCSLLLLFDEILHGTNSRDRVTGAEALIRRFLEYDTIGLVTTHDLALTEMENTLSPYVTNVHFQDRMRDGVIEFDYQIRPGVVQQSNALALMRAVGLEV